MSLKSGVTLSKAEKKRFAQEQEAKQKLAKQERLKEIEATAKRALDIWNKLPNQGSSIYLQRKKVAAFNIRFSRGSIVLPVQNFEGVLSGLQFIDPDGNKKFLTGTVKKGRFCPLGEVNNPTQYIGIAEGYATAASVHMATGWLVLVAFDAGNLKPVAEVMRQIYPQAKIIISTHVKLI